MGKVIVRCTKCHARLGVVRRCESCGLPFCSMHLQPSSHRCGRTMAEPSLKEKAPSRTPRRRKKLLGIGLLLVAMAVTTVLSLLWLGTQQGPSGKLDPAAEWLRYERMKAGYGSPKNETVVTRMKDAGMNAIVHAVGYFDGENADQVEDIRTKAELCRKAGVKLFISIFYFTRDAGRPIDARKYVSWDGEERAAPCPLDWSYWEKAILPQALALAELAKEVPIAGFVLDTEMYNSDRAHIYSNAGCFCDDCFDGFLSGRSGVSSAPRDEGQRHDWLEEKDLLDDYYEYLRKETRSVATKVRARIEAVNPGMLLGFLLYDHNWYYRGLVEGLGTAEMPVIVFDESTYGQGWGPVGKQMVQYFPSMGYNAFYLPGLWLAFLSPERIESEAYYCGANSDGYWIFPFDSLSADPGSLSGDFVLNGSQQAYWDGLASADSEIAKVLAQGHGYQSLIPYYQKPDATISFELVEGEDAIRIVNGGFIPRTGLKVAVNGRVSRVAGIDVKSKSESIAYVPEYTGSTGIYGQRGLNSVAVMEKDGTIHQLLGSTLASVFE